MGKEVILSLSHLSKLTLKWDAHAVLMFTVNSHRHIYTHARTQTGSSEMEIGKMSTRAACRSETAVTKCHAASAVDTERSLSMWKAGGKISHIRAAYSCC